MNFIAILSRVHKPLFPHISRIFPAGILEQGGKALFWIGCIAFLIVNTIYSQYIPQPYALYRKALLERPFSIGSYVRFGQALFSQGNSVAASKQIAVATNVLGAQTELTTILSQWEYASQTKERSYNYWKQIVVTYPDYRDGYVQLAQVSYDLAHFDEVKQYIAQAQALDPNNEVILQLQKEIGL